MTKIFGLCPRCKSRIRINNVERLDGRKIACRDCGYTIRIQAGKAKSKSAPSRRPPEELEITEFFDENGEEVLIENLKASAADAIDDEEFSAAIDRDGELPAYRPLARRPKAKKRAPEEMDDDARANSFVPAEKSAARKGKLTPLKIVLICVGFLIGFGAAFAGVSLLRSGGGSAKFEPPEKYVAIPVGLGPLAGEKPEGWNSVTGGGANGIPIYVRINHDDISIDIRETEGSSAKGKMKKAIMSGQELNQIGGPSIGRLGEAPGIDSTHGYHLDVVMKNFSNYRENAAQPIETGFGMGLISDFTAEEGLFHSRVKGCRASLVARDHQYNIVCKCPAAQFKAVKPVFEKIVASLNPDEGPRPPHRGKLALPAAEGADDKPADTDDERPGKAAPTPHEKAAPKAAPSMPLGDPESPA
jgi:hypothetical protein